MGVGLSYALTTDSYVESAHFANKLLVLGEEKRQFGLLKCEGECSFYDIRPHVVCIVLCHQSRGHVNAHHLCCRGVDIFHERGKTSGKGFVKTWAKQTIHNEYVLVEYGRVKLLCHHCQRMHFLAVGKSLPVGCTVGREMSRNIEEPHVNRVVLLCQHPCHSQCIAAIITWSGKDNNRCGVVPFCADGMGQSPCRTFHEVDRFYRLIFYRKLVQFVYLDACKYFHTCKNTKFILIDDAFLHFF